MEKLRNEKLQNEKLRIGIAGLGVQGSLYAGLLAGTVGGPSACGRCVLAAVSTGNPAALEKLPETCKPAVFSDWREMAQSDACDAVVITVPHFLHPEIACGSLRLGKAVLCEKPAGVFASTVREMADTAAKTNGSLAMMFNRRAVPENVRLHAIASSGELGELRHMTWIINSFWRPDGYYAGASWRGTWRGEGGGMLVNQLAHQLDLLLWFCGGPVSVRASLGEGRYRKIGVENEVAARFTFAGGATGELIANGYDPFGTDRLELLFSGGKLILDDEGLTVIRFSADEAQWNAQESFRSFSAKKRTEPESLMTRETFAGKALFWEPYAAVFDNLAAHVLDGEKLIADAGAGLLEVQLANCLYESAWTGEEVRFPGNEERFSALLRERMEREGKR